MPSYRIHRMKDTPRQNFRWAPHTSGVTPVKPRDYEANGTVEESSPYAAWFLLRETERPLDVGDLLESDSGELRIYKYVGFEEARWVLPEVKSGFESEPLAAGAPVAPANL
ncbi:MAG TPA: hypothetical protein DEH78_26610 [Solibacterales bacterium]|nr:hypothetical protein [Bryobacterales bacterium]